MSIPEWYVLIMSTEILLHSSKDGTRAHCFLDKTKSVKCIDVFPVLAPDLRRRRNDYVNLSYPG